MGALHIMKKSAALGTYLQHSTYSPFLPSVCFCLVHREFIMDKLARRCGRDPGL